MTYYSKDGSRVLVCKKALQQMRFYRQNAPQLSEAGGILIGRLIQGSPNVVIDEVSVPYPSDKRSRFRFNRSIAPHQTLLHQLWLESEGTTTYLGEWHTHPEWSPTPSSIDLKEWSRLTLLHKKLLFIIVGIEENKIWESFCDKKAVQHQELSIQLPTQS